MTTTTVANFKPLPYFEWVEYIRGIIKLSNGFKYSELTECLYDNNGNIVSNEAYIHKGYVYYPTKATCPDCDGCKEIEVMKQCGRSTSMCCGGCSEMVECDKCDDNGMIESETKIKI